LPTKDFPGGEISSWQNGIAKEDDFGFVSLLSSSGFGFASSFFSSFSSIK